MPLQVTEDYSYAGGEVYNGTVGGSLRASEPPSDYLDRFTKDLQKCLMPFLMVTAQKGVQCIILSLDQGYASGGFCG